MNEKMAAASGSGSGSRSGHGGGSNNIAPRNHPFRLEVQDITPVSASILWSLRPPPLSAIPRNLLRQPKQQAQQRQHHATASTASSASSSNHNAKLPANRLAGEAGVTATRSVNRKVTKVTLRNISPHKQQTRLSRQGQGHAPGIESEGWPSDDEGTAVDEDEQREEDEANHERSLDEDQSRLIADDYSEASDDGAASAKIFDSGISVCVNGVPWSQVMMGDRGVDEAFMVVYGLSPSRDYELMLKVEGGEQSAVMALSTTAEGEEKNASVVPQSSATTEQTRSTMQPAPALPGLRVHTPPMQDTDASPVDGPSETSGFPSSTNAATASSTASSLSSAAIQASIRRARKDASRAESALRSEIEAIKRGLERMSDVDHRSKQKVLALQESIRQATLHAKDIDEEASEVEGEREEWERREREKEAELQHVKRAVEENLRQGDAKTKQDDEEVETVEKELHKVTRLLEDKWAAKLKVERERVAEAEQELLRVQMDIDNLLRPQPYSQGGNQYYPSFSQEKGSLSPAQGTQANSRGKGRGVVVRGGSSRSPSNSTPATATTSRKTLHRTRGPGYTVASDDALYDYHGPPSSSTHGSTLNPHNPEFVPASASPIMPKTADQSPSASSRFAFASSSHLHRDYEASLLNPSTHMSPRINNGSSTAIPWTGAGGPTNQSVGVPYWSTSNMNPSPTLGHDIWGALPSNPSPLASTHQSPSLRTKTSMPYLSPLRNPPHITPSEDSPHRIPHFHFPHDDDDGAGRRGGSASVSPSLSP